MERNISSKKEKKWLKKLLTTDMNITIYVFLNYGLSMLYLNFLDTLKKFIGGAPGSSVG